MYFFVDKTIKWLYFFKITEMENRNKIFHKNKATKLR